MKMIYDDVEETLVEYNGYEYIRRYDDILEQMSWFLEEYRYSWVGTELHLELENEYQKLINK